MKIKTLLANPQNYEKKECRDIKYIVVHYTANDGDTAESNAKYFNREKRGASAHYFVDEKEIYQSVPDMCIAWHCGQRTYHRITNNNTIGVEMCSRKAANGTYYLKQDTQENAAKLIAQLAQKYDLKSLSLTFLVRHYDVTGKNCPAPLVPLKAWENFKSLVQEEIIKMNIVERKFKKESKYIKCNVINLYGKNYIKVSDIAELLEQKVDYDPHTKLTEFFDR